MRSIDVGAPPAALLIGALADVWGTGPRDTFGAWRAWHQARDCWLTHAGIDDMAVGCTVIPEGAPWTLEYGLFRGQAERAGLTVDELAERRLSRAGRTLADLAELRQQAAELSRDSHDWLAARARQRSDE